MGVGASQASFIAAFGRLLQVTVRLCYGTILLSVLSVMLVYCGQMIGWIMMPLFMEVGLGPGDIVLGRDPDPHHGKGHSSPPTIFQATSIAVIHLSNC